MKIREFNDKSASKKRNLLTKELGSIVEDLFPDSLDDIQAMTHSDQAKKKSSLLVIPRLNNKMKLERESSEAVVQKIAKLVDESTIVEKP